MPAKQNPAPSRQQRKSRQIDKEVNRRFHAMLLEIKKWPLHRRLRLAVRILIGR